MSTLSDLVYGCGGGSRKWCAADGIGAVVEYGKLKRLAESDTVAATPVAILSKPDRYKFGWQ